MTIRVSTSSRRPDALVGLGRAALALERERPGHHTDGQRAERPGDPGDDRRAAGAGAAALARGDEHHVGALERRLRCLERGPRRLPALVRVGTCAEPTGQVTTDVELDVGVAHQQRLGVGVDRDELHASQAGLDHAVDGVDAATADADDLDDGQVVL